MYDERMLAFLARIAEMHVDPTISYPRKIEQLPDDARTEDEGRPNWPRDDMKGPVNGRWMGLQQDVGIFSEKEWNFIMCKCVASMGKFLGASVHLDLSGIWFFEFDCNATNINLLSSFLFM